MKIFKRPFWTYHVAFQPNGKPQRVEEVRAIDPGHAYHKIDVRLPSATLLDCWRQNEGDGSEPASTHYPPPPSKAKIPTAPRPHVKQEDFAFFDEISPNGLDLGQSNPAT
jgi:hypothetical protein